MSSAGLDRQLVETLQRRLDTMQGVPKQKQVSRLIGWLQRRGHKWDVISAALKQIGLLT